MTERGMVFTEIVKSICWTSGWGTNGSTERYPEREHGEELSWLVENGYLFHFEKRGTHSGGKRRRIANYHMSDRYGITSKGWAIAGKYIDATGTKLEYQLPYLPKREAN